MKIRSFNVYYIGALGLITLAIYFIAGFFPDGRKWGVNYWGYFSDQFAIQMFVFCFGALVAVAVISKKLNLEQDKVGTNPSLTGKGMSGALAVSILGSCVYWMFRTKTHFLGDGYHILAQLALNQPQFKSTEIGETWIHTHFMSLLNKSGEEGALFTYQFLSVLAGFIFLFSVTLISCRLFGDTKRRVLFVLGIATSGFGILFFGYVEHYTWVVLFLILLTLSGFLSLRGIISKWIVLILLLLSISLHVIALAAAPAVLYLLLRNTSVARLRTFWRIGLAGLLTCVGLGVFSFLYRSILYFKFALVPLVPIEITVNDYTLFSLAHLADFVNLIFLLVPAFFLLIYLLLSGRRNLLKDAPEYRFLFLMIASCSFCVFVIDPKLGMPRDWDLFSLAGIPLVSTLYLLALEKESVRRGGMVIAALSSVLALAVLVPRLAALNSPEVAIMHVNNYKKLDKAKNRTVGQLLWKYYTSVGDLEAANREGERWKIEYMDTELALEAGRMIGRQEYDRSIELCHRALKINPMLWVAYSNLGWAFIEKGLYDSALAVLKIADGINPGFPEILFNLGRVWYFQNELAKAEKVWVRGLSFESTKTLVLTYLVRCYKQTRQFDKQVDALKQLSTRADAPVDAIIAMVEFYLERKQLDNAAHLYNSVANRGQAQDSLALSELLKRHLTFREYLQKH